MGLGVVLGTYGALLLGVQWRAGPVAAASVLLLGALPALALVWWYAEDLAPVAGLLPKRALEQATQAVRREEQEAYRQLQLQAGGESMEWLNFLVEQLWPKIAKYAEELILGFEAKIQASVPVPGGIRFKTCSLGRQPIKFGPVRHRKVSGYYDDEFVEEAGVELDIGITYHSDVEIVLATRVASVGVASINMTGSMSVIFRPLVGQPPFFGGVEVLFTNPPNFDLDFKGIGNLADMPGIYTTVRRLIDEAIAGVLVMPERIAVPIIDDPKVDLARLRSPAPEGVLRITVCRAESLEGKDVRLMGKHTSDPYVQIKAGAETWRTPTVRKTCSPVWTQDNIHDFVIYSTDQCVQIDVFDWDRLDSDDHLGSINKCPVAKLIQSDGKGPLPWKLEARNKGDAPPPVAARLYLQVEWLWLVQPLAGQELGAGSKYMLAFKVDDCEGVTERGVAPYTVKLSIKNDDQLSKSSSKGWGKWTNAATAKTLDNIRKLAENNCDLALIADVTAVQEDLIKQFLAEDGAKSPSPSSCLADAEKEQEKRDQEWLAKLRVSSVEREQGCNPQFEEVLLLSLPIKDVTAVVELLGDPRKRPKSAPDDVVARFEVHLGDREAVGGPFALLHPGTGAQLGEAKLKGTFTLWRLGHASKLEKLKGVARMLGTRSQQQAGRGPAVFGFGQQQPQHQQLR